jgi:predicted DCC family thiol-disulfide oxidoreductase YuxK
VVIYRLFVLYDARCGVCSRLRQWMLHQPAFVHFEFVPAHSERARRLFPSLDHGRSELMVVTDGGEVYIDDAAWLMCLWSLREYRSWSYRFARGPLRPFARAAWDFLSANRQTLAQMLALRSDEEVARELAKRTDTCES